ncbi:MAG: hypothetical protein IKW43_01155 [Bacteroidaceae bacterium]|nr:hypothetical protein [Bacteroidaceae bacterium]
MIEAIMVPAVCGMFIFGFLKLFELFVCKKERLLIIEKMGDKFTPDMLEHKINFSSVGKFSSTALKFGCLLMGLGLGLLIGYLICSTTLEGYAEMESFNRSMRETVSIIYGACILLFGGIGLLTAFLVELKINKDK